MFRISPSLLDSYRYFQQRDFDQYDDPERAVAEQERAFDDLVSQIKRIKKPPTEAMALGVTFEDAVNAVEAPAIGSAYEQTDRGFTFSFGGELLQCAQEQIPPHTVTQVQGRLEIGPFQVNCRADYLNPFGVADVKTRTKAPLIDTYLEKYQWRCYLECFGRKRFTWQIYQLAKDRRTAIYRLKELHLMNQYAYPGMRADIERTLNQCAGFCDQHGLLEYITLPEAA